MTHEKIMDSRNFNFLRSNYPELAELGAFAEYYAYSDPASALVKLRLFGENLVADFLQHHQVSRPSEPSFLELISQIGQQGLAPPAVLNKLHALRLEGNRAAHDSGTSAVSTEKVLWILKEAFELGKWFVLSLHEEESVHGLSFEPPVQDQTKGAIKRDKKAALQKLAAQEVQMHKLLEELESVRKKAKSAEKTVEEQKAILAKSSRAANALDFNEAETRKYLIDRLLVQAGWDIEDENKVGQEVPVDNQPTETGKGKIDYVLYGSDGKPLAVVEAKKTARSAQEGETQAKLYADGLEKQYGQRPIIFYTNGYDIRIWDDAKGEVPRRLYSFYNEESLVRLHWRTTHAQEKLSDLKPRPHIIDRPYQIEAVKRVCENFDQNRRKALIVLATGTGKTRVAIALSELLIRARRVKRILFLCDRRELRKQANNAYTELLPNEPCIYVTANSADDRSKSIYAATYPAMMKCYQSFDVGFFDLIIADESHRSIYNRYRHLFSYFDALQVGLTATPKDIVTHDTYRMFDCSSEEPTAHFSYKDAIEHVPPYLADFKVISHTTKFLRQGIKYAEMDDDQKKQLDEQVEDSQLVDYTKDQVDKAVFNKDTDRKILRNLMENGICAANGQHVGKTIIFARNHQHAMWLKELFDEMYPQYMKPQKEFCAVIDNYEVRAEQLIDDFKGAGQNDNLTIAISVDMLDTGIDVPEVVNLVFAKPVKSYVKFWQMIGRGTRLCPDLLGPGKDKEHFCIFDHWGNFEFFGDERPEEKPAVKKSLMQQVFEARLSVAETALLKQDVKALEQAVELLEGDVRALPDDSIAIREKWRPVKTAQQDGVIRQFDPTTVHLLRTEIAPLMQWRDLDNREAAYRFDLLVAEIQVAAMLDSGDLQDLKGDMQTQVGQLPINLKQVQEKIEWINQVKGDAFWEGVDVSTIDEVRRQLRSIMHCRVMPKRVDIPPLEIDVEDPSERQQRIAAQLDGVDLSAYRRSVETTLKELLAEMPVLQKIKAGQPVSEEELRQLIDTVVFRDPNLSVDQLLGFFDSMAGQLELAIRQIIGLDAEAVDAHFRAFLQKYNLTSHQMRFLALVQRHIVNHGKLELDKLYEDPFTQLHNEGVDGVFDSEEQIDGLIELVDDINQFVPTNENK